MNPPRQSHTVRSARDRRIRAACEQALRSRGELSEGELLAEVAVTAREVKFAIAWLSANSIIENVGGSWRPRWRMTS